MEQSFVKEWLPVWILAFILGCLLFGSPVHAASLACGSPNGYIGDTISFPENGAGIGNNNASHCSCSNQNSDSCNLYFGTGPVTYTFTSAGVYYVAGGGLYGGSCEECSIIIESNVTPTPTSTPTTSPHCVCRSGYCFMSGNFYADQAALFTAIGGEAAAAPWAFLASIFYPCSEGSTPDNTTPTITPTPTWIQPTAPPTWVVPTATGGNGGTVPFVVQPHVTTMSSTQNIYTNTNLSLPTNVSMPLLPATLPALPDQLNTTSYIAYINSTFLIGPSVAIPLNYIHAIMQTFNNIILYFLSFLTSPFQYLTTTFTSVSANLDNLLGSFGKGASLITALMWYSLQALPVKVLNVFSLALFFDIIEQIFDWPTELSEV